MPYRGKYVTRSARQGRVRLAAVLLAGLLSALSAASVTATYSTLPKLSIGSPGAGSGTLTLTPATAGATSTTTVDVKNIGSIKAYATKLFVGKSPAAALPAGVTIVGTYGPDAGACAIAGDARSLSCTFGDLAVGASRSVSLIVLVRDAGDVAVQAAATGRKSSSSSSSSVTVKADGSLTVAAPTCDAYATFLAPGTGGTVTTGGAGCTGGSTASTTSLQVPVLPSGARVQLSEAADDLCIDGASCFGPVTTANVNDGAAVGLTWTMTWKLSTLIKDPDFDKRLLLKWPLVGGVVHVRDDGTSVEIDRFCKHVASGTDCIVSKKLTLTTWSITFRTPTNGRVRGFG